MTLQTSSAMIIMPSVYLINDFKLEPDHNPGSKVDSKEGSLVFNARYISEPWARSSCCLGKGVVGIIMAVKTCNASCSCSLNEFAPVAGRYRMRQRVQLLIRREPVIRGQYEVLARYARA